MHSNCQKNIHGITMPKYYPNKFNFGYNVYVRHNVKNINTYYKYTKLSCDVLVEVIQELFKNVFKNVDTIYYKGGEFEKKYFKQFTSDIVKIVDIGIFDIEKYISKLGTINNLCHHECHKNLKDITKWRRHCPQYEVLAIYDYDQCT